MEKLYAKDYRKMAHDICVPYSSRLAVIYLIYALLVGAMSALSYVGVGAIAMLLLSGPLALGLIYVTVDTFDKKEPEYSRMFDGFNKFGEAFVLSLLQSIFIFLWSLLFVIPGIIKTYSYSMAFFIMKDEEGISANDAITKSRQLMNGHKWELFCLEFSYIGWLILCVLTFGILSLWVSPKMAAARYAFYLHISGKDQKNDDEPVVEEAVELI